MSRDKEQDSIIRLAAEVGSQRALETYIKEKQKERKQRVDRRLRDTKRLMRNYREIKIHAGDAIASLSEITNEDYEFFKDLMEDNIEISAITRTKARSAIMLSHIDAMLQTYQTICYTSKKPEDQRRYRVLESMCLLDEPMPISEIAAQENIDTRTVYRDFDVACEKMSALLFGVQFIERE